MTKIKKAREHVLARVVKNQAYMGEWRQLEATKGGREETTREEKHRKGWGDDRHR